MSWLERDIARPASLVLLGNYSSELCFVILSDFLNEADVTEWISRVGIFRLSARKAVASLDL